MNTRMLATIATCLLITTALAQEAPDTPESYTVPRNEHGQPDFEGAWGTVTYTMLERPPGLPPALPPEQAAGLAQVVYEGGGDNTDPDVDLFGPPSLFNVKGELRTSVVVYPEDGRMPFNERGEQAASHHYFKGDHGFDHPEERPGVERCLESWGAPPMRAFHYHLIHTFVQLPDQVVIVSEDMGLVRVIHMNGKQRPAAVTSFDGHSVGRWEGDTLVVETTHFRGDMPDRATIDRPMLISGEATVTERFTRVSDSELFYQYTVDDPTYYTEPWRGEFSFTREEDPHIYEYSCHEGNYSMVGALRGERVREVRSELGVE